MEGYLKGVRAEVNECLAAAIHSLQEFRVGFILFNITTVVRVGVNECLATASNSLLEFRVGYILYYVTVRGLGFCLGSIASPETC